MGVLKVSDRLPRKTIKLPRRLHSSQIAAPITVLRLFFERRFRNSAIQAGLRPELWG